MEQCVLSLMFTFYFPYPSLVAWPTGHLHNLGTRRVSAVTALHHKILRPRMMHHNRGRTLLRLQQEA